jgi:uncharacterized protein
MERPSPLARLALLARRRSTLIFAVLGTLDLVAALLALRLRVETDPLRLLAPAGSIATEAPDGSRRDARLLVAIRIPPRAALAPYERLADELAARLESLPEIRRVEHRAGSAEELAGTLFPKGVLLLDERGRRRLAARLSDAEIWRRMGELRRLFTSREGPEDARLAVRDPLGLAEIFLARLETDRGRGGLDLDWTRGYHLSHDRRLLLLLAEPSHPAGDLRFDRRLAAAVDDAIASALAAWPALAGAAGSRVPQVAVGGAHFAALDDAGLIARDLLLSLAVAGAVAFLTLLFAFRRPEPLLYALAPLASALLLTAGFAGVAIGAISAATSWVAALLVGVETGFVIVYYGRYLEERRRGAGPEEALLAAGGAAGRAIAIGAAMAAAAFYALTLSGFTAIRQIGLLAGTGVLLCAAAVLLLLPGLLAWREERGEGTQGPTDLAVRRPRLVLAAGVAIALAALVLAFRVSFDASLETMRPRGSRGVEVAREVDRHFGPGSDRLALVVSGRTPEETLALASRAAEGAERLKRRGVLRGYGGISALIPPPAEQARALAWRARERTALDRARIRATFAKALAVHGLPPKPFEPGLDLLERALSIDQPIGLGDFPSPAGGRSLPERFLEAAPEGWRTTLHLEAAGDRARRGPPSEVLALARKLGPRARLAGTSVVEEQVRARVLRDARAAGLLALALVAALLWLDLRSLRSTLLALVPPLFGIAAMLGGLALLGVPLTFLSAFLPAVLLGLGAGYGAQVLRGYREEGDGKPGHAAQALPRSGEVTTTQGGAVLAAGGAAKGDALPAAVGAVLASALAATAGLGSIVFSHYPGLRATGVAAILGLLATGLAAVVLLPALLSLRAPVRQQQPAEVALR